MFNELTLLKAISSTEEISFRELCGALGNDKPEEKSEWAVLFKTLRRAEKDGLVEIDWADNDRGGSSVNSVILTESGAARVRVNK